MASWEAITAGTFWDGVFTPLADLSNGLNAILGPIQTILGILRSILKIIRVFLLDATSLVLALIKTLVKQITDFIRNLGNSGIFFLAVTSDWTDIPSFLNGSRGGFDGFVEKIISSLEDPLDPFRPLFPSSQKVGGVAIGITTGNLVNALNFLSVFFAAFQRTFNRIYPPPTITGAAGNSANIIQFNRPSTPTSFFTGVKFTLERTTEPGGVEKKKTAQLSTTNPIKNVTVDESDRDTQTGQVKTTWTEIATVEYTNTENTNGTPVSTVLPEQIIFIDQNSEEGKAPHLVSFDLSKQADSQGLLTISEDGQSFTLAGENKGPIVFTIFNTMLGDQPVWMPTLATKQEISQVIPASNQSDLFKSKFIPLVTGEIVYLDFRVNGLSIPHRSNKKDTDTIYIESASTTTIALSKPIAVGSKVECYAYVMASSADILLQREFNAGHKLTSGSAYTEIKKITNGGLQNGIPYYYRVRVSTLVPEGDSSTTGIVSNEIRLVPRQAYAPNPSPAFCLSANEGPFVIKSDNNILHFKVGAKSYEVSLPLSKKNIFAANDVDFGDSFGLLISPEFSNQTNPTVADTAVLLSDKLERLFSNSNGLTFYYVDGVGKRKLISPSQYIPIDIDEVVMEIKNQINDPSVIVKAHQNRILIQDNSKSDLGSSVEFLTDCASLGFSKGLCMNVQKPVPPNWNRLAIKDFLPQIGAVADLIDSFVSGILSSAESPIKSLIDFIDLLDAKIKSIQSFISRIQELLDLIGRLQIQLPNIYKLEIPVCNGTDEMKAFIERATRPLSSAEDFAVGVVLIAGGVGAETTVSLLNGLL
jgi:hypothetical protein